MLGGWLVRRDAGAAEPGEQRRMFVGLIHRACLKKVSILMSVSEQDVRG